LINDQKTKQNDQKTKQNEVVKAYSDFVQAKLNKQHFWQCWLPQKQKLIFKNEFFCWDVYIISYT